ncbi:MFS transporter [Francisella tularensis]|uniref:Major facilitator superfamily (MFS) transport protein n=3 Tax=Francisella tularensis TaxID=263 RepID=Q5NG59_FRATT|nr:MFS transporter [Francisella tularensis]ADA78679.1 major facilitator superfamily (MFS) transport protein [Francisella tularensis subsp. tularensis NE061598]AFB79085.1 Major facilitator family transporter [Francisella tularensis subsp. tularensis TIGB03]AFB80630.1 Major facilitator family transporter [Francisella tularensis subsp. tularensis TI0902]AJI68446.1 sugar (and other) transporter family protein [Francisella tularensis subsp. tularensis SCHU S4]AJI71692.1 sugar (and other) transporte
MLKKDDFKTILLTSIGGMLEFYDFVIFGMFAIVLGKTFFPPEGSPALQALSAFTVFAVGYFARPFGGIIFGHIGDKYGRKKSFLLTILLMGLAAFMIAILPSYQNVGIIAPLLFVILRIIQSAAIGGEIPSAVVFVKESLLKHGGLACGIIFCFINFGIFFAEITKIVTTYFLSDDYAWRVAFMFGGIAAIISYFFRKEIHETAIFLNEKTHYKIPIIDLFKTEKLATIRAIAAISIFAMVVGFFSLYLPTYFELNHIANSSSLILINLFVFSVVSIPAGFLADKFTPLRILFIGAIGLVIFGSIFYYGIVTNSKYLLLIMLINNIFMGLVVGVASNYASTLFSPVVRASGLGFSYNISFAIFNGAFLALASLGIAKGFILTPLYLVLIVIFTSTLILVFTRNTSQNISI